MNMRNGTLQAASAAAVPLQSSAARNISAVAMEHKQTSAWGRRRGVSFLVLVALCAIQSVADAQVQQAWIARYNNGITNANHRAVAMAFDPAGNIVVAGNSQNAQSNLDYVVIKYSPQGTQLWASRYDSATNGNDQVRGLAVDGDGFVYLTGTSGTIKYNPGGDLVWSAPYCGRALVANTNGEVYVTGFSEVDFATAKLSVNGSNLWVRTLDLAQWGYVDVSQNIALDTAGNCVIGGKYQYACEPPFGCYDELAMAKYDADGKLLWTVSIPNIFPPVYHGSEAKAVLTDGDTNAYLAGVVGSGCSWKLAKVNPSGGLIWQTNLLPTDVVPGIMATRMDEGGNLYLTGSKIQGGDNNTVYKTFKITNDGLEVWRCDYYEGGYPWRNTPKAIAIDAARNVYVTGASLGSSSGLDWATLKISPVGAQLWVKRYNGSANSTDEAEGILVDASGNVYVTGYATLTGGGTEVVTIKYVQTATIERRSQGAMRLQFPASPDQSVGFQFTTNFLDWLLLGSSLADTNGIATFDDTNAAAYPYGFYRALVP